MKRADRGSIEILEEAVYLLRNAPLGAVVEYLAGAIPFLLALLYFLTDMTRSPFAAEHLASSSLGLTAVYLWKNVWQAAFMAKLYQTLSPAEAPAGNWLRLAAMQSALQPVGLVLALPLPWLVAFFRTFALFAALGRPDPASAARRQAIASPRQNWGVLLVVALAALLLFVNVLVTIAILPQLARSFLGIEGDLARLGEGILNWTTASVAAALTWLVIDPLLDAVYVLRCFYGESLVTGEDLRASLRQALLGVATIAVLALALGHSSSMWRTLQRGQLGASRHKFHKLLAAVPAASVGQDGILRWVGYPPGRVQTDREPAYQAGAGCHPAPRFSQVAHFAPGLFLQIEDGRPESRPARSIDELKLERSIKEVVRRREFTWRAPRALGAEPSGRWVGWYRSAAIMLSDLWDGMLRWLRDWLYPQSEGQGGGAAGAMPKRTLELLTVLVVALGTAAAVFFLHRRKSPAVEAQAVISILPAVNLSDESLTADQLPESSWLQLADEWLAKGDCRLALRALYLAALNLLGARGFVSLRRWKSGLDYCREVDRRARVKPGVGPELASTFTRNVAIFERGWYGAHPVDRAMLEDFSAGLQQMRIHAK